MTRRPPLFRESIREWTNLGIPALPVFAVVLKLMAGDGTETNAPNARPEIKESEKLVEELVADSQKHRKQRTGDPNEALRQAEEFTKLLGSDVSELGRHQRLVVAGYCAQRRFAEALERAEETIGGHQYIARALVADAAARAGQTALALAQVKEALEHANLCANGLQKDELRRHAALALLELGEEAQAAELSKTLPPADQVDLLVRSIELGDAEPGRAEAPTMEELKKLTAETKASASTHARLALAWAERQFHAGRKADGDALLNWAGEVATSTLDPAAHLVLVDIARAAKKYDAPEVADRALRILMANSRNYADTAEWKAAALARAAVLCREWGRAEEAAELMTLAEASAPKVFVAFAPQAWLEVARGHLALGRGEKATAAATNALRAGMAHPHPRVRAMAAVQTCLFYADMNRAIPAPVMEMLDRIRTVSTTED